MRLESVVQRLRELEPAIDDACVARLALVILRQQSNDTKLDVDISAACLEAKGRIASLQDQRLAASQEVEALAANEACEFKPQQVFAMVRGLRAQGQLLELLVD